jgi:surfactin synthase thioesterase subunit
VAGRDDASVPLALLDGWAGETLVGCESRVFAGGHFYLFEHEAELLGLMQRQLCPQRKHRHAAV